MKFSIITLLLMLLNTASAQDLNSQWWQWALSIPASVNPLTDATGDNCFVGQRGTTWFLAGVFFGGSATRACSIPENTTLFFPAINSVQINTPNVCGLGPNNLSVADMEPSNTQFVNGASQLLVELDHKQVNVVRMRSPAFAVALPPKNLFDAPCASLGGVPAGIYSPAVADGLYAQVGPLTVGPHTLRIRSRNATQAFAEDVTYNLTVVPVSLQ